MKKFLMFFVIGIISFLLVSCDKSNSNEFFGSNNSFFQKGLKTTDQIRLSGVKIDASYASWYITPSGFDYDELIEEGYSTMKITLTYDLMYKKTFTGWDVLYAGKPKYDISIEDEAGMGLHLTGLETTEGTVTKYHSYSPSLIDLKDNRITLEIGSLNIQNEIYFSNIKVDYRCY